MIEQYHGLKNHEHFAAAGNYDDQIFILADEEDVLEHGVW